MAICSYQQSMYALLSMRFGGDHGLILLMISIAERPVELPTRQASLRRSSPLRTMLAYTLVKNK